MATLTATALPKKETILSVAHGVELLWNDKMDVKSYFLFSPFLFILPKMLSLYFLFCNPELVCKLGSLYEDNSVVVDPWMFNKESKGNKKPSTS